MDSLFKDLRAKAEQRVINQEIDVTRLSADDIKSIIHNLDVHRIELEMQNDELQGAVQQIEKAKKNYQDLFESAPVGYVILLANFKIEDANHAFAAMIGAKRTDILNRDITEFIDPDFQDLFHLSKRRIINSREKLVIEMKLRRLDQQEIWVNTELIARDDAQTYLICFSDITRQKNAEKELAISAKKLREIIQHFPNGSISLINKERLFEVTGGGDYSRFGIDPKTFIGNSVAAMLQDVNAKKVLHSIDRVFHGASSEYEIEYQGEVYRNVVCPVLNDENQPEYALLIASNITEAVRKEREITELLTATRAILKMDEFTVTAQRIFDACKRSIGAKAGYVALLSETGEENELLFLEDGGLPCEVDPNLPMPVRGLRQEAYRTGKVVFENDFMNSKWVGFMPEGHMDLPNVLFAPLNIDGQTLGVIGIAHKEGGFTDNDARIAAAFGDYAAIALKNSRVMTELKQYTQKLKEANHTKDKFFSIISHDLKNAFVTILSGTEVLENIHTMPPKEVATITRGLNEAAKQQYQLLENLLEWARLQTDRIEIKPARVELTVILAYVVHLLQEQARQKEIALISEFVPGVYINADSQMIETVIRNLVTNAIKFTRPAGQVKVIARPAGDRAEIVVVDNGVGMSRKQLDDLFRIDRNHNTSGTANESGTGLGLILSKEFIQKHGGTIRVESELERGSTFTVSLPRVETPEYDTGSSVVAPPFPEIRQLFEFCQIGDVTGIENELARIEQLNPNYETFVQKMKLMAGDYEINRMLEYLTPKL